MWWQQLSWCWLISPWNWLSSLTSYKYIQRSSFSFYKLYLIPSNLNKNKHQLVCYFFLLVVQFPIQARHSSPSTCGREIHWTTVSLWARASIYIPQIQWQLPARRSFRGNVVYYESVLKDSIWRCHSGECWGMTRKSAESDLILLHWFNFIRVPIISNGICI